MSADGEANALQPWWQSFASSWFLLGRAQVMILCAFTSKPQRPLWLSQMTLQMMRKRFNEWDGGDRGVGRRQTTREHCFCSATAYCLVCNYHYKGVCAQAPPRSSFVHISAFHSSFALFGCCRAVLTPSVATGTGCVCARFPSAFFGAALAAALALAAHVAPVHELLPVAAVLLPIPTGLVPHSQRGKTNLLKFCRN